MGLKGERNRAECLSASAAILGTRLDRAERALNRGETERALTEAGRLLTLDPRHLGALEVLAKAQWQAQRLDELQITLDRLMALNPYEPGYHALRGAVCQQVGRCGDAIRAYRRAVAQDAGWAARVGVAVRELEALQAGLIAELHREDPVFRAEYQRDPVKACRSRGFEVAASPVRNWTPERPQPLLVARPS